MQKLNLNHLHYFWAVARLGTVSEASREIGVSQPAVSTQIRSLERSLGTALFRRTGRRMELTPVGQVAMRHAEEMFRISDDLVRSVGEGAGASRDVLTVGVSDAIPKIIARSILEPLRRMADPPLLVCREWRTDQMLAELSMHRLGLVIADAPIAGGPGKRTVSHSMGQSQISLYATPALAKKYSEGFPKSLDGAPLLLPADNTVLRPLLQDWISANNLSPVIVAEAEDRSMLNYLGESGMGLIPAARVIENDLRRQFGLVAVGPVRGVREQYYAITLDRKTPHPAVAAICTGVKRQFQQTARD